jgi:predicted GIY-YIG superfamily endonuclease
MEYIYILQLEKNKYYIGKTKNIEKRYKEHKDGTGSKWTKKYKPIKIINTFETISQFDEDKYVKEYMSKYGIENVRGGSYVSLELDDISIITLQKEIWHSKNLCTRCGRNSHFVENCYAIKDINGNIIDEESYSEESDYIYCCEYCDNEFDTEYNCIKHEKYCKKRPCDICGKKGHRETNCFYI